MDCNFSNFRKEAWGKIRPRRNSNPCLPRTLWTQLGKARQISDFKETYINRNPPFSSIFMGLGDFKIYPIFIPKNWLLKMSHRSSLSIVLGQFSFALLVVLLTSKSSGGYLQCFYIILIVFLWLIIFIFHLKTILSDKHVLSQTLMVSRQQSF